MKRKVLLSILLIIFITILGNWYTNTRTDIVSKLNGKVYYLKRDKEILNIYACDANLSNKGLLFDNQNISENYVMDLHTGKSNHFIDGQKIQWVQ